MEAWRGGNRKDRPEAGFFQGERKNGVSGTGRRKDQPQFLVALAHNRNDLAETMLHHLARGTGLRGLAGIRPCGDGIIRPVLCLERREIVNYLKEKGISYITDSTNLSDEYTRNRIRHHVLPAMEKEINPRAVEHMAETARMLAAADHYLLEKGSRLLSGCERKDGYLFEGEFFREDQIIQEYAVLEAFGKLAGKRKDFTALHVEQVLSVSEKGIGRYIRLPQNLYAVRQYEGVHLGKTVPRKAPESTESLVKREKYPAEDFGKFRYLEVWNARLAFSKQKFFL